ncbi:SDR family NAD(P)-dependent oxidoreductase [Acidimangrovimonas sediminis]|uniref:SDR family NAD(P)-dependent oxidoreductase n=1 Tax=Acidimangrovimonas sediminis TaxID=2056283 RepID=UPI000C7F89FA|nr:glucose 1-dehydrogenase [Acidimangrovimonas sediminis]
MADTDTLAATYPCLADKVVIVTGAAQGMGAMHARRFVQQGSRVVIADIQDAPGQALAGDLTACGPGEAMFCHLDVASAADWQDLVAGVTARWGRIDVLVNNAAVMAIAGIEDETEAGWDRIMSINPKGSWLGIRAVIPEMRRLGGGSIINIGSIAGFVGSEGHVGYQTSKGAVRMLTKNAAMHYAPENIRVNLVAPGIVDTGFAVEAGDHSDDEYIKLTPLGRLARPEEISAAVLFLASSQSSFITGLDMPVDGGFLAQ